MPHPHRGDEVVQVHEPDIGRRAPDVRPGRVVRLVLDAAGEPQRPRPRAAEVKPVPRLEREPPAPVRVRNDAVVPGLVVQLDEACELEEAAARVVAVAENPNPPATLRANAVAPPHFQRRGIGARRRQVDGRRGGENRDSDEGETQACGPPATPPSKMVSTT